ncbi:hypothetical protein ES703_91409 [subsurface metagenome]
MSTSFNLRLTNQRINDHLQNATIYNANGDYVQAGEKVYGAIVGIINKRSNKEIKPTRIKKQKFINIIGELRNRDPTKIPFLTQHFQDPTELWSGIFALHEYFYGTALNYTDTHLEIIITYFIQLLQML